MDQNEEQGEAAAIVIIAVFIISTIIYVSRAIFQITWPLTQVGVILTILSFIFGSSDTFELIGGVTLVLLVISGITWGIGYGFGGSEIGQAILEVDNAFDNVSEAEVEAKREIVNASKETTQKLSNETNSTEIQDSTEDAFFLLNLYLDIQSHLPWLP